MNLVALCNLPWDTFLTAEAGVELSAARRTHLTGNRAIQRLLGSEFVPFREHESMGGSPVNAALTWLRLGGSCTLVGPTGDDDAGAVMRDAMRNAGIRYVEILPRPAEQAHSVAVATHGPERIFSATIPHLVPGARIAGDAWTEKGWTLTSTYELGDPVMADLVLEALRTARERGHQLAFDFADRHFSAEREDRINRILGLKPDVVLCNTEPADPGSLAPVVLVSRGPEGVDAYHRGSVVSHPAPDVPVKDTTGAGDALLGGFLWEWARGADLESSLACGLRASGDVLQVVGAHMPL